MGNLENLTGRTFKSLNASEIIQVVNSYIEDGKYFHLLIKQDDDEKLKTPLEVIEYFERVLFSRYELKTYFYECTN